MCTNNISFVTKVWLSCHLHDKSEEGEHEDDPGQHGSWGWRSTRCSLTASSRVRSGTRRTGRNSWWPGPRGCRYPNPIQARGMASESAWRGKYVFSMNENHFYFSVIFCQAQVQVYSSPSKFNLFIPTLQGVPKKGSTAFQEISFPKSIKTPNFFWKNGR